MAAAHGLSARRKARILYVLDGFPDPHAGTESQFWMLFGQLDRSRFEPAVLLLRDSPFLQANLNGVSIEVLGVTRLRSLQSLWRIVRAALRARRQGIDIAHLFFNDVSLVFPPLLRLLGVPVIVSRRDLGFWYTPGNLKVLRLNARFATAVIANCEAVSRAVVAAEHFEPDKVNVIYNGIECDPAAQTRDLRRELSLGVDARLIVIVANLRPLKRIDDAVRALAVVAREVSNVHLVVVGEDRPDETGRSFRARLESLAGELQVREQLHCLGKIPNPLPLVRAADICVLCSETEGLSNAVIEYMLAGKPVICTDVGGNRELVVNEETGFLISLGDVAGMARRMVQLLMGPELARAMGERGGERARRLFSREAMIAHHEALYLQLLQRPSAEGVGVV